MGTLWTPLPPYGKGWTALRTDPSDAVRGLRLPDSPESRLLALSSPFPDVTAESKKENERAVSEPTVRIADRLDPVDVSSGEFTYSNVLMRLPGALVPFEFAVDYRSRSSYDGPVGH